MSQIEAPGNNGACDADADSWQKPREVDARNS